MLKKKNIKYILFKPYFQNTYELLIRSLRNYSIKIVLEKNKS